MIQAHPSLFMRQVHNYQKVGKAGVVITGEGQSSCWTCRGPRGLLLQKKKQPPKKIIRLGRLSKSQSCKTGSVYAAHPHKLASPSRYPPPPPVLLASHMLYDKKIRPLNEWRHGGLVNRPCDDGDTVRGGRFTRLPSKRRSEAWKLGPRGGGRRQETFFLFFAQGSAGNSTHLTRFLQSRRICFSLTDLHVNEEKLIPSKLLLF